MDESDAERSERTFEGAEDVVGRAQKDPGKRGCLTAVGGAAAAVLILVAVALITDPFGGDDDDDNECGAFGAPSGEVALPAGQKCTNEESTTTTAEVVGDAGPDAATPAEADLSATQVLYKGTSGGEIGCITCDGQSRFIHITRSTTAKSDENRAGQEIVWPESGTVVDFGFRTSRPNKGRYGINVFVNGSEYGTGCALETGWSACRLLAVNGPSRLEKGERVTIIIGEGGTLDEDGHVVDEGDFTATWWFVFEPD